MPVVSEFYGIKILMYWNDHMPAHFHAEYGDHKIIVDIVNGAVIKGIFPSKQLRLVLAWCEIHKDELTRNWKAAKEHQDIQKINPLI